MSAWLNSQWAWTSSKSTAEGSVVPLWQTARDKGMRHGTSNGSACAVTMSPSGHKYSYQLLLPTTALYQDLCQPAAMLSSLSLSFTHTHTHLHFLFFPTRCTFEYFNSACSMFAHSSTFMNYRNSESEFDRLVMGEAHISCCFCGALILYLLSCWCLIPFHFVVGGFLWKVDWFSSLFQWNLVCDSAWKVHIAKFSLLVGSIFGYLVMGVMADW